MFRKDGKIKIELKKCNLHVVFFIVSFTSVPYQGEEDLNVVVMRNCIIIIDSVKIDV